MKKLLLTLMLGVAQFGFAQLTCATATPITTNGTITAPAITGTYVGTCAPNGAPTAPKAIWYSYTATANGEVTVSSNLPSNVAPNSVDTRVSILTGTCAALSCYGGNDDVSATNFLSSVTFPVAAGTTYLISWDNRWSAAGFDFTFAFNAASCIRPNSFSVTTPTNITQTSATVNFAAAIGNPASYDIEYGAPGFVQGTSAGTIVNTTTTSKTITGLTAGTIYNYYLRSNCGATQSAWAGPFGFSTATPVTTSFAYGFDNTNGYTADYWSGTFSTNATAGNPQAGTQMVFSNNSLTAPTNARIYTRPLYMTADRIYTISFYLRSFGAAPIPPQSIRLTAGTSATEAAQTSTIWSNTTFNAGTWTMFTTTYTPPVDGTYYLSFNHFSPVQTSAMSLALDTFAISGVLGVNDVVKNDTNISVYPNPVSDILNIKSKDKVKNVEIFDMSGKKINVELNDNAMNVKDLQSGSYILSVETPKGKSTQKFIKK